MVFKFEYLMKPHLFVISLHKKDTINEIKKTLESLLSLPVFVYNSLFASTANYLPLVEQMEKGVKMKN